MRVFNSVFLVLLVTLLVSCAKKEELEPNTMKDTRDNRIYKTIIIGKQEWMAENLDVSKFRNGNPIPQAKTEKEWIKAAEQGKPAWCYYDLDTNNGKIYGKLYNWFAVNDPRGLAPEGWHIPTDKEWTQLIDFLGGPTKAGAKMKSSSGWIDGSNGTNESGFSGLPAGYRSNLAEFFFMDQNGGWWSSTEKSSTHAWFRVIFYDAVNVARYNYYKSNGLTVRCVKD